MFSPQFPDPKTLIICWIHSPTHSTNVCDTKHESTTRTSEGPAQHGPITRTPTTRPGGIQPPHLTRTYSGQRNSRVPPSYNDKGNGISRQTGLPHTIGILGQAPTRRNQDKAPTPALLAPRTTNPWKSQGLPHIYIHTHKRLHIAIYMRFFVFFFCPNRLFFLFFFIAHKASGLFFIRS